MDRIAHALDKEANCRDQATQTGELIRTEDGLAATVDILETLAG
ncbi:MAG: hypothetical protein ABIQ22_14805 [Arthrobacter oryzae]